MIRHCVFIRFTPEMTADEKMRIYQGIGSLMERLPGCVAASFGGNVSPELGMDKGYSDGFIMDFADASARDDYLADPEHQRIGSEIVGRAVDGVGGVLVFDMEIAVSN